MKLLLKISTLFLIILMMTNSQCFAKGGFSSGGGRSSGFSSSRSYGGSSRSYSSGSSYSSSRSYGGTSSRTTITRNYYGGGSGYYYHPMMMYPGFGMGYGYSNGMIEGLIIGSMMHPSGTTVYNGGGYQGQALMYPDGRVANQQGIQVGTYANGVFTPMDNGPMIAQPAPANPQVAPDSEDSIAATVGGVILVIIAAAVVTIIIGAVLA